MGRATANPFWPRPLGPGEGQKVKYHLISITKSISKIFIPNFVFVLTKHIRWDFHSVTWVMPQGLVFEALGVLRGSTSFFSNMVMWHFKLTKRRPSE